MNDRSRPKAAPETPATKSETSVTPTAVKWRCRHARTGYCVSCVSGRRRAQFALEAVAPVHHVAAAPARFRLDDDALRAEARRLYASGWSVDEIEAVLDVRRSA